VNMHLPERWGYVEFAQENKKPSKDLVDWTVRQAVYNAQVTYAKLYGGFTMSLKALQSQAGLPRWVREGTCTNDVPVIKLHIEYGFIVTISDHKRSITGEIRGDRLLTVKTKYREFPSTDIQ